MQLSAAGANCRQAERCLSICRRRELITRLLLPRHKEVCRAYLRRFSAMLAVMYYYGTRNTVDAASAHSI